jgi:hypothetical protein
MPTLAVAPGLYVWEITLADGGTAHVLASSLASAVIGTFAAPPVGAQRGPAVAPPPDEAPLVLDSLVPAAAVLGDPSFTLHVHGSGFRPDSAIIWNGSPEPTTFVGPGELTTGVDMSTAINAIDLPVMVRHVTGAESNALPFTFSAAAARRSRDAKRE